MNPLMTSDLAAIHRQELLDDAVRSRRAPATEPTHGRVAAAFHRIGAVHFGQVLRARRVQG
jgi:hypothetical protein